MTTPEPLDPESTAPALPDGYDPDGGWEPMEWWAALGAQPQCRTCRVPTTGWIDSCTDPVTCLDRQRDADFDDEERRP